MPGYNVVAFVHLVGFLLGASLYATLLGIVTRPALTGGTTMTGVSTDRLPLVTAILGLIWNVTGLAAYAIRDFAGTEPHPLLIAIAYLALGYLPAVVVHSVLRSEPSSETKRAAAFFIAVAYAVSTLAAITLVWSEDRGQGAPSARALQMLTWSYAALTVPVLMLTRKRTGARRAWSIVALAVFAVSALHLSHHEGAREPLLVEIFGHHASIPLIFAILYQDFRFALADVFLKRALAVFALVGLCSTLYLGVEIPLLAHHDFRTDAVAVGLSVIMWTVMALLYPAIKNAADWSVDHLVLRRVDYATFLQEVARSVRSAEDAATVLDVVSGLLRGPLAADRVTWAAAQPIAGASTIPVPTTEAPRYELVIGPLAAGRRLLSGDTEMLHAVAALAARRIDAIRLEQERSEQRLREQDIGRLATEAELRALRAQVNPHFLFNALNTLGYLIQTSPVRAQLTLQKLSALLRGVLRASGNPVRLGDELDLVHAYLDIERARFEERLAVRIEVGTELREIRVPPFLIQPLVENAIKHGIAPSRDGGLIEVSATLQSELLVISVRNTGACTSEIAVASGRRHGVGLANLEARLRQQYGPGAGVTLVSTPLDTIATMTVPLSEAVITPARPA
jgi:two-component system LytT family sensor kinase